VSMSLVLREVRPSIRDDETEIAGARVIHMRVVDFVENAEVQCESRLAQIQWQWDTGAPLRLLATMADTFMGQLLNELASRSWLAKRQQQ
jgi:hypothetical protein